MTGACGTNCGIARVREAEKECALALARQLYPGLVWRRGAAVASAVSFDALAALGGRLEEVLPVRSVLRLGEPGSADALYLLAGVHAPGLCEVADGALLDPAAPLPREETYLRLSVSPYAPLATLQEVRVTARRVGDDVEIVERPCPGVTDRRLRTIVKGLQGAVRRGRLTLLDMAFLMQPIDGLPQAEFMEDFHEQPTLYALLFDAAPPTTVRASLVPRR